jgi:hypothetical protein
MPGRYADRQRVGDLLIYSTWRKRRVTARHQIGVSELAQGRWFEPGSCAVFGAATERLLPNRPNLLALGSCAEEFALAPGAA